MSQVTASPSIVPTLPRIAELTSDERAFTERTLLALVNDIVILEETTERVVTMFRALALQYRVQVEEAA